jgi:DUF2889 family protein
MAVGSPYLVDAPRYERTMTGWVDVLTETTLGITFRIMDPWVGVELATVTTPTPEYRLLDARGRVLVGPPERIDPGLSDAMPGLVGLQMTAGFSRRVAEVAGPRTGASYFVDAAIEAARLARLVAVVPAEHVARRFGEGPIGPWRLDMEGWTDLPSSCYTYRPESELLFAERPVVTSMRPAFYMSPPGTPRVLNRTRVARVERDGRLLRLAHTMLDEGHSLQAWCVVDTESGRIVDAGSYTPRLPYSGICTVPQARIRELIGQPVDAALRKRLGGLVGGETGCAQLYDLIADLLRLLTVS